jgi:signal peptidase I
MIQYFKFSENTVESRQYTCLSGKEGVKFLAKRLFGALFLLYATFFVAAANPFAVNHPSIFIVGGLITLAFFIRAITFVIRYMQFKGGSILLQKKGITITGKKGTVAVDASAISYIEYTLLGDFKILNNDGTSVYFPIHLLKDDDRKTLLLIFPDMAPSRTVFLRKAYELGDAVIVAMILAVHIIQFVIQHYYIPTGSMEKTLMIDDHLFGEKITFGPHFPKMLGMKSDLRIKIPFISRDVRKGDIIIFVPPLESGDSDKDYIKRCVAVEGDDFKIKDNSIYLNGVKQKESYTQGITSLAHFSNGHAIEGIVPKGMVIAMGDNRENSSDSRAFGYVPVERIKARAFILTFNTRQLVQFDFSRFGLIR